MYSSIPLHVEGDALIEDAADVIFELQARSASGSQVVLLNNPNTSAFTQFRHYNQSATSTIAGLSMANSTVFRSSGVGHLLLGTATNANLNFMTNNTLRYVVDGGTGHFGIGYTDNPPYQFCVTDGGTANPVAYVENTATSLSVGNYSFEVNNSVHTSGLSDAGSFRLIGSGNAEAKFTGEGTFVVTPRQATNDPAVFNGLRTITGQSSVVVELAGALKKQSALILLNDANGGEITNAADATSPTALTTQQQVDAKIAALLRSGSGIPEGTITASPRYHLPKYHRRSQHHPLRQRNRHR